MKDLRNITMANNTLEQYEKLLALISYAIEQDNALRDSYQVADKFRFIRDRLALLHAQLESEVKDQQQKKIEEVKSTSVAEDELQAFVYLYNAQGRTITSWKNLLKPSIFYEYSVNRPIYTDRTDIEAYIRSKQDKSQHGIIMIAIKKSEVVLTPQPTQDSMGRPLIKVKEGGLHFERFMGFVHNGIEYLLDAQGNLVKK